MTKYVLIKSRKPDKSEVQIQEWLQTNPNAKIIAVTQYVGNGFLWTSIFYE